MSTFFLSNINTGVRKEYYNTYILAQKKWTNYQNSHIFSGNLNVDQFINLLYNKNKTLYYGITTNFTYFHVIEKFYENYSIFLLLHPNKKILNHKK